MVRKKKQTSIQKASKGVQKVAKQMSSIIRSSRFQKGLSEFSSRSMSLGGISLSQPKKKSKRKK